MLIEGKLKTTLYPKTKRVGSLSTNIVITEKLDGSNLGLFKIDNELLIAQRNWLFTLSQLNDHKGDLYKGLFDWLANHGERLKDSLHDRSGVFGEWLGMGCIKYQDTELDNKFYMFAKANILPDLLTVEKLNYDHSLFIYPFVEQEIPEYIKTVPIVRETTSSPTVEELDLLYEEYSLKVNRRVEGFVINNQNNISKYVRYKRGIARPHIVYTEGV